MSAKQPETIELDSDDEYSIEEVLDKKIQNGQVLYWVKWKGYGNEDNTWELVTKLSCFDLVAAYEEKHDKEKGQSTTLGFKKRENSNQGVVQNFKAESILRATIGDGQIMFLIKWMDLHRADWVPSLDAHTKWSQMVIKFYEDKIEWTE